MGGWGVGRDRPCWMSRILMAQRREGLSGKSLRRGWAVVGEEAQETRGVYPQHPGGTWPGGRPHSAERKVRLPISGACRAPSRGDIQELLALDRALAPGPAGGADPERSALAEHRGAAGTCDGEPPGTQSLAAAGVAQAPAGSLSESGPLGLCCSCALCPDALPRLTPGSDFVCARTFCAVGLEPAMGCLDLALSRSDGFTVLGAYYVPGSLRS